MAGRFWGIRKYLCTTKGENMCENCDVRNGVETLNDKTLVETNKGTYLISTISIYDTIMDLLSGRTHGDRTHQSAVLFLKDQFDHDLDSFGQEMVRLLDLAHETNDYEDLDGSTMYTSSYFSIESAREGHDWLTKLAVADNVPVMTTEEQWFMTYDQEDPSAVSNSLLGL